MESFDKRQKIINQFHEVEWAYVCAFGGRSKNHKDIVCKNKLSKSFNTFNPFVDAVRFFKFVAQFGRNIFVILVKSKSANIKVNVSPCTEIANQKPYGYKRQQKRKRKKDTRNK